MVLPPLQITPREFLSRDDTPAATSDRRHHGQNSTHTNSSADEAIKNHEAALRAKLDALRPKRSVISRDAPMWSPEDKDEVQSPSAHPHRLHEPRQSPRPPPVKVDTPNTPTPQAQLIDLDDPQTDESSEPSVPAMQLVQQSPGTGKEPGIGDTVVLAANGDVPVAIAMPDASLTMPPPEEDRHTNMLFQSGDAALTGCQAPDNSFGRMGLPCGYPGTSGKVQGWLAVPFVQCLVGSSYVAMVCFRKDYSELVISELVVFHLLWLPMVLAYMQCVLVNPGTMDDTWREFLQEKFGQNGDQSRYCLKSGLHKPPRSHFCSVSGRLVLNMDHFCPWIGNTVGFFNKKFFILFLFYVSITTAYTALCFSIRIVLCFWNEESSGTEGCYRVWLIIVCCKDLALATVLGNFCHFHYKMVCVNQTSVEYALNSKPEYDIGREKNLEQVFGVDKKMWLVPLYCNGPSFNGIDWPTKSNPDPKADQVQKILV